MEETGGVQTEPVWSGMLLGHAASSKEIEEVVGLLEISRVLTGKRIMVWRSGQVRGKSFMLQRETF